MKRTQQKQAGPADGQSESPKQVTKANKAAAELKPGSSREAAAHAVGGQRDFGVPVDERHRADREYTSQNTKASDPGVSQPADFEHDGVRDHGAGVADSGPGSGSGGDIDTDVIGVGTGGNGVAQGAPSTEEIGAAEANNAPLGATLQKENAPPEEISEGDFISRDADASAQPNGQGSDAVTNSARDDDSFAGEVSSGEGRGEDSDEAVSDESAGS